ncbi:MAG TPA: lipoyl synthase, partial [Halobacteriales archaeon]|nr:lipoyl synthase [Halobacteriales archaeon]
MSGVPRKPEWLRMELPAGDRFSAIRSSLRDRDLHTVC